MKLSLRVKLSLAILLVMLIFFATVSILANMSVQKQFKDYVIDKQEQKNENIVGLIESRYGDWGEKWDVGGLANIGINTLGDGLILRIKDHSSTVLWDANVHNNGMCTAILEHMAVNMQSVYAGFEGGYTEKTYPVLYKGVQVGSIDIGYYGPYFYTDMDIRFLNIVNSWLIWGAVVSSLLSVLLGILLARQLTKPISHVIGTAQRIAKGDYSDRVAEKSSTKEIIELKTAINSLAETLGKQENLRKRLTADVAHELRTPLATLQSHLEAMIDGIWKPEPFRLQSCYEETVRLAGLVGDLENLTRYEGGLTLNKNPFDLMNMLSRIVTNFQPEFKKKGVRLELEGEKLIITGDENKLSQAVINLISNALKYTDAGGRVQIKVRSVGSKIEISVTDNGAGISREDIPHIFERFYRTDQSRSRDTGGAGIGLTIAKSIVEAHCGDITVESEMGKGSIFRIILPQ